MLYMIVKYEFPANPLAAAGAANTNPADQQGMPYGYDETTLLSAPVSGQDRGCLCLFPV